MEQNDKKLRENNNNNNTNNNPMSHSLFLSENGCLLNKQPYSTGLKDHGFSFEAPAQTPPAPTPPPPPSSKTYLYDFQNLGNQLPVHGSSSNQLFGVQTGSNFDPFDFYPYGSSANIDFYDYESKPFASDNSINGGHAQVMESFHGGLCGGGGAGGYFGGLSLQRNPSSLLGITNHHVPFMSQLQDMKPMDLLVPDDVSSASTADQAYLKKVAVNKNRPPVLAAARKPLKGGRRKNNVVKGQWTIDEDRLLIQLVDQFGIRKWSHIAQMLPGRIGKQCRERWHNHLRPDIKKDTWTEEEDKVLIQAHAEIGNKWAEIAKRLPGRTENSIKNHWNATKRRQYSKRKCRSKYPRGTLLQEYIKSLNLDSSSRRQQGKTSATVPLAAGGSVNANNVMKAPPTTTQPQPPPEALDFGQDDCLVPNYNFDEVPDFDFDEKIFKDGCTIDSLLDEIPCDDPLVDDDDMDVPGEDDATPLMDYEVKKEIDLVEMISQSKNPGP